MQPQLWEYTVVTINPDRLLKLGEENITSGLDAHGDVGWELVALIERNGWMYAFMKRPKAQ